MQLIYQLKQTSQTTTHIYLTRHLKVYRIDDKFYLIEYSVTDLFDCLLKNISGKVSYSARHQRYLEREINKGRYIPIEEFSDEDEGIVFHRYRF